MAKANWIADVCVGDLVHDKQNLVAVTTDTTVADALRLMHLHNFVSVPVEDARTGKMVGVANLVDIVSFVAFGPVPPRKKITEEDLARFESDFQSTKVADLLGVGPESSSGESGMWVYLPTTPLEKVLEPLCKGVHRVLVDMKQTQTWEGQEDDAQRKSSEGRAASEVRRFRILTQMDVVRFLCQFCDVEGARESGVIDLVERSVKELGLVKEANEVHAVPTSVTALDAFRSMNQLDLQAIVVVDANTGVAVSNLSAADLRGLKPSTLKMLLKPVLEFLDDMNNGLGRKRRLIAIKPTSTLATAMLQVLVGRVHRVWVLNDEKRPVGVVTLSDILRIFYRHACA